jgi:hypothetical protein
MVWEVTGALDFSGVFEALKAIAASGDTPASLTIAAVLIAAAALLKSAQVPLHGWITEVMETPTPVSAPSSTPVASWRCASRRCCNCPPRRWICCLLLVASRRCLPAW